jgi:hypothetical protein
MHRFGLGVVLLAVSCSLLPAATAPIGVAVSAGQILLDNASLPGNATVFEGSTLGSGSSASTQVRLNNGATVRLALSSSGKMYLDHVDLINGSAEISGYAARANGLKIKAEGKSSAEVTRQGKTILVAALTGDVHVFNAQGISVANLLPGRVMNFLPQDAGASAPSSMIGCAVKTGNNFLLTDETSSVTVQLRGADVRAGRRVQITGNMVPNATPAAGASQVINVTNVKEVGGACKGGAPGSAGAAGAAAGSGHGPSGLAVGAAAAAAVVVAGVTAGVVMTSSGSSAAAATVGTPVTIPGGPGTTSGGAGSATYNVTDAAGDVFAVTITPAAAAGGTPAVTVVQTAGPAVSTSTLNTIGAAVQQSVVANQAAITANPSSAATVVGNAVQSATGSTVSTPPSCVSPCSTI